MSFRTINLAFITVGGRRLNGVFMDGLCSEVSVTLDMMLVQVRRREVFGDLQERKFRGCVHSMFTVL